MVVWAKSEMVSGWDGNSVDWPDGGEIEWERGGRIERRGNLRRLPRLPGDAGNANFPHPLDLEQILTLEYCSARRKKLG